MAGTDNLIPFSGVDDPRRQNGRGRPSYLNDPEWVDLFAEALANGLTKAQLAEEFDISESSVKRYKRDARVKSAALKHIEDRIHRITRHTDSKLDYLLRSDEFNELPIEEKITLLLKVRKETLGGVLRLQAESGKVDAGSITDAMDAAEADPEFAKDLAQMAERLAATRGE